MLQVTYVNMYICFIFIFVALVCDETFLKMHFIKKIINTVLLYLLIYLIKYLI